jgi:CubicO group peptidase (beta-lactamase class C family)
MGKGNTLACSDSPIKEVELGVRRYIQTIGIAPQQLVLGLATFVTDYTCNSSAHSTPGAASRPCTKVTPWESSITRRPYRGNLGCGAFSNPSAQAIRADDSNNVSAVFFDEEQQAAHFDYHNSSSGSRHQVWYLDERAIAARRLRIVDGLGLRGMGAFMGDFMGDAAAAKPLWRALAGGGSNSSSTAPASSHPAAALKSDDSTERTLIWPTQGWTKGDPEQHGMDSAALAKATQFVRDFNEGGTTADRDGYYHPPKRADAFLVARHGVLVAESYWGSTNRTSMHTVESGTKSIGATLLMHAAKAGHFSVETNVSDFFPGLRPLSAAAAEPKLRLKHLLSMAGGLNESYYRNWTNKRTVARLYPGMLQGPPGAIASVVGPGILKAPGSDFVYSMANPILAQGILEKTSGASFAKYADRTLFPILGIDRSEWRWLGDREGLSQSTGSSFHTARNYLKVAYLMLRKGTWDVAGKVEQLLERSWVDEAGEPTPASWGPCETYSHFFWRKALGRPGFPVPADTYYMFGGGGQYAVIVPSLDLVVVSLFGGSRASFAPPLDIATYKGRQYFPSADEEVVQYGNTPVGHWNFTFHEPQPSIKTRSPPGSTDLNHVSCSGWPPNRGNQSLDLLSGMMQAVVAAIRSK